MPPPPYLTRYVSSRLNSTTISTFLQCSQGIQGQEWRGCPCLKLAFWMSLSSFPKHFLCPITLSHCRLHCCLWAARYWVTISTCWSYVVAQLPLTVIFYKSGFLTQHSVLKRMLHLEKDLQSSIPVFVSAGILQISYSLNAPNRILVNYQKWRANNISKILLFNFCRQYMTHRSELYRTIGCSRKKW